MAFDYKTLDMESLTVPPLDYKDLKPEEYRKCVALRKAIIDIWIRNAVRYIIVNGKKYRLTEAN